jgi:hypothetical protein
MGEGVSVAVGIGKAVGGKGVNVGVGWSNGAQPPSAVKNVSSNAICFIA